MHSWKHSIEQADKKALYRAERLAATHNPVFMEKHGEECKSLAKKDQTLTIKRIRKDTQQRIQNHTPSNSVTPIRLNRGRPKID